MEEAESVLGTAQGGFFSVGIHPWYLHNISAEDISLLELLCSDKRVVLIGECGIDKNSTFSAEMQIPVFEKQILISERISKPLIVHCVGSFNELFVLRKKHQPTQRWIIHGFRGKPQLAEQILQSGCDISFGEKFNPESVRIVPFERLFIETDQSEISIEEIYHQIAAAKNCKIHELLAGNLFINEFSSIL